MVAGVLEVLGDSIFIIGMGDAHQETIEDDIGVEDAIEEPVEEGVAGEVFA